MSPKNRRVIGLSCLLLLLLSTAVAQAQPAPSPAPAPAPPPTSDDDIETQLNPVIRTQSMRSARQEASLSGVLTARKQIEEDLRELQEELRSDASRGREGELEAGIQALSEELENLDRSFSELSTGVDPLSIDIDQQPDQLNLATEVRDLLGPLVNELKRVTSRPREIDRLRTEISELEERLGQVTRAIARVDLLRAQLAEPSVLAALDSEKQEWTRRQIGLRTSLQVAKQKLEQRLGERQSITEAIENLFQLFFKSRGRNLLLALLATVTFLLGLRRLRAFLQERPALSRRSESFEGRVFSLIYSAFTVVGALLVFLVALYFFGDWVLLILVLLLILGLIWTSKQAIPRFWSQTVLILDMGPVRENERLHFNGLPYFVESISFYTKLVNPALIGGTLRIPIDDLSDLRSRAFDEREPWFPTQEGDVVLLPDGRPGRVEYQSIEAVRLQVPGQNRVIIPAAEFVGQSLEKLSDGYRVDITFGLDYGDQAGITTTMRERLARGIEEKWRACRWSEGLLGVSVEFETAGASSLDFMVRVDLDGSSAIDLQAQKRLLAAFCVDVCNEEGWVIPFTQLTLHMADGGASETTD